MTFSTSSTPTLTASPSAVFDSKISCVGGDTMQKINGKRIHTFRTVGMQTFTCNGNTSVGTQTITYAQVLIVGGGGGGGNWVTNEGPGMFLFTYSICLIYCILLMIVLYDCIFIFPQEEEEQAVLDMDMPCYLREHIQ